MMCFRFNPKKNKPRPATVMWPDSGGIEFARPTDISRNPVLCTSWISAFAGMTMRKNYFK